jgi:histidinol dehydrogenase
MRLIADPDALAGFLAHLGARRRAPDPDVEAAVRAILEDVRLHGDAALCALTEKLDGVTVTPERLRVPAAECRAALDALDPADRAALTLAADRIRAFHTRQRRESWLTAEPGTGLLGQLVHPIRRVGLYVPGGTAAYPSSVLMNAIPARVAGVGEIALCTPPGRDGAVPAAVLAAAAIADIQEVYRVGGAQAIAGLAYGTASIPPVDKIVGPGNIYVATAKRLVFGQVGIDLVAGPSEVLIVADETATPAWVAADLLAQAEHDPMAAAICLTPSQRIGREVQAEVARQIAAAPRQGIAAQSLDRYGAVIRVPDLAAAVALANTIAPEHLELLVADPWALVAGVRCAGAVFLGHHSPEPAGDYLAGPNHVLPTGGAARFCSGLSVDDFQTRSNLLALTPAALTAWRDPISRLAELEGLSAHARAIQIRTEGA